MLRTKLTMKTFPNAAHTQEHRLPIATYHLAPALRQAVQATASLACRHHQDVRPLDAPAHRRDRGFQFVVSEMKTVCVTTKPVRDALCSLQAPLYFVRDDSSSPWGTGPLLSSLCTPLSLRTVSSRAICVPGAWYPSRSLSRHSLGPTYS